MESTHRKKHNCVSQEQSVRTGAQTHKVLREEVSGGTDYVRVRYDHDVRE